MWYCSKAHQVADWKTHKGLCKAFTDMRTNPNKFPPHPLETQGTAGEKKYHRLTRERQVLTQVLKRPLTHEERDYITHRPACFLCDYCPSSSAGRYQVASATQQPQPTDTVSTTTVNNDVTTGNTEDIKEKKKPEIGLEKKGGKELVPCPKCHIVSFCSHHQEAGQKLHQPECQTSLLFLQCQQIIHDFAVKQQNLIWLPEQEEGPIRRTAYVPLPGSWDTWLRDRRCPMEMYHVLPKIFTTHLSVPVSIVYILERIYTKKYLASMKELSLHLLGPEAGFELAHASKFEEILHLLPALQKLEILFIGPEVGVYIYIQSQTIYLEICMYRYI